jgi:DNA end-binding protein Ku
MARPIWKGQISFGLVNVPITLYPAEQRNDLSFHLVDSRDSTRVRYERVNETTGEEVPWDKIVKGFEYDDGNYVLLSDEDLVRASPELTKTIEIEQFVGLNDIDVRYFDKPYYVVPGKGGEKGYVLLREALAESGKVGIARVVIRARQHLAALLPREEGLILELLRFPQELRSTEDFEFPAGSLKQHRISTKELALAGQLIEGMSGAWDPEQYEDEYRRALMEMIRSRIKSGDTEQVEDAEDVEEPPPTVNFMDVLKRSVARKTKPTREQKRKPASRSRKSKAG